MAVCRRKRIGNSLQKWKVVGDICVMLRSDCRYEKSGDRDFRGRAGHLMQGKELVKVIEQ